MEILALANLQSTFLALCAVQHTVGFLDLQASHFLGGEIAAITGDLCKKKLWYLCSLLYLMLWMQWQLFED